MNPPKYDVAVIGGGIVGLATASTSIGQTIARTAKQNFKLA